MGTMKTVPSPSERDVLAGLAERVIFPAAAFVQDISPCREDKISVHAPE
jgi:hypothetical protein